MDLKRKLQKLVDPEIVASTRQKMARLFHPIDTAGLLQPLQRNPAWAELRRKYPRSAREMNRWAEMEFWIKRNVERAQDLALDRPPPKRLLDLGCGAGYFLYVARHLGHQGIGLDLDQEEIFRDILPLLGVERIVHRIAPFVPLPRPTKKFDLITSYLTCFHRIERLSDGSWKTWEPEAWQYFLDDLRQHQLAPEGVLMLEFHPQQDGLLYPAAVRELFQRQHARFSRSRVFF